MTPQAQQAVAWWARARETGLSPEDQRALEAWLETPANREAFNRLERADAVLDQAIEDPAFAAMLADAVADVERRPARVRRRVLWSGAAAAAAACMAIAFYMTRPAEYATSAGERREVALSDGSTVTLDQSSRIKVAYSSTRRSLTLLAGRAEFDVAKDKSRPFVVTANAHTVTAIGTVFDVGLSEAGVAVTLARGVVAVAELRSPIQRTTLTPGQRLVAGPRGVALQNVDIAKVTAWSMGKAVFDNERLAEAVSEMNAYAAHPIVLRGGTSCARLTAVYDLNDTAGFVEGIAREFSLRVAVEADQTIVLEDPQARACEAFRR
jgi:transmembrane sensor